MSWGRRIAILAALIVFVLAAIGLVSFISFSHNTKSEYMAAAVIRSAATFVKANNGRWPRSWKDLEFEGGTPEFVFFDFALTSEKILGNPELLQTAIQPRSKYWVVYPHHKRDLEELLEAIKSSQPIKGVAPSRP